MGGAVICSPFQGNLIKWVRKYTEHQPDTSQMARYQDLVPSSSLLLGTYYRTEVIEFVLTTHLLEHSLTNLQGEHWSQYLCN